jgi:hypothetical protein
MILSPIAAIISFDVSTRQRIESLRRAARGQISLRFVAVFVHDCMLSVPLNLKKKLNFNGARE